MSLSDTLAVVVYLSLKLKIQESCHLTVMFLSNDFFKLSLKLPDEASAKLNFFFFFLAPDFLQMIILIFIFFSSVGEAFFSVLCVVVFWFVGGFFLGGGMFCLVYCWGGLLVFVVW